MTIYWQSGYTMDQHAPRAPKPKKAPTPASWKPGTSGNPLGRPRKGTALTESIRAGCDPNELRDIALRLARDGKSESTQIAALNWLRDSGFTRPAEKHEIGPPGSSEQEDGLPDGLTLDELRELTRLDEQRAGIIGAASQRVSDPLGSDDDVMLLPAAVAPTDDK
jgi:hypothetical protein